MSLAEQFPRNRRCIERCGKVALCTKMIEKGEEDLERAETASEADFSSSGPEYETEDNRLIPLEEYLDNVRRQKLRQAGGLLISSGTNMRRMLLEGCTEGAPFVLTHCQPDPDEEGSFIWTEGASICRSEHAKMVFFTDEDLER